MSGIQRHRAGGAAFRFHPDLPDDPLVLIALVSLYAHILAKDHPRKTPLRLIAEGLGFLWSIDTGEANLVLLLSRVQHRDGIAIGHANVTALDGAS